MEEEVKEVQNTEEEQIVPVQKKDNKKIYLISGLIALAIVIGAGYRLFVADGQSVLGKSDKKVVVKTVKPTPTKPVKKPNAIVIKSSGDLQKFLREMDSASTSQMESEYNKAVNESSSL